ncbi:DUF1284 domain-containing protein [Candidatus Liberibacter africanus]|uniref:2Fe-2S ferredoxin n=1 Tax=Candidatus Liberibacter africanus PTSAPSY TaxID=1277257 RepID=A0A0G3I4T4_LIBAF|nr:DUF1284 domain-containing protein [Candidatus Liberibacter africanus]AKK20270.1 hypothetical protein G293_03210 [Candidatus Liberibacter africanus PTSAPSY]QTP64033.1 DUF1284 domain-containing protein [Candidatus Liberibacter africanus]
MTIRLRPHHLLCILTYAGEGYSDVFVANFNAVISRLKLGEDILIVSGPDDICAPLLGANEVDKPHCVNKSISERDHMAESDVGTFLGYQISEGAIISLDFTFLHRMRKAFTSGQTRRACVGCEWNELCSSISLNGYTNTLIHK